MLLISQNPSSWSIFYFLKSKFNNRKEDRLYNWNLIIRENYFTVENRFNRLIRGWKVIAGTSNGDSYQSSRTMTADSLNKDVECHVNFRWSLYSSWEHKLREGPLRKMSAAVENGVETSKPRGVFSRAFAKRAQPFEEGESCGKKKSGIWITMVHMGLSWWLVVAIS